MIFRKINYFFLVSLLISFTIDCSRKNQIRELNHSDLQKAENELQAKMEKDQEVSVKDESKIEIEKEIENAKIEQDSKKADIATRALETTSTKISDIDFGSDDEIKPPIIEEKVKTGKWGHEGWGGNPEILMSGGNIEESSEKNWFYKVVSSEASDRAKKLKSPSYIEFTCKNSARKDKSNELIDSLYSSIVENPANLEENQKIKNYILNSKTGVKVANCRSTSKDINFSTCECILYIEYQGGKEIIKKKVAEMTP